MNYSSRRSLENSREIYFHGSTIFELIHYFNNRIDLALQNNQISELVLFKSYILSLKHKWPGEKAPRNPAETFTNTVPKF